MKRAIVVAVALAMILVNSSGTAFAARPRQLVQAVVVLTAQVDPSTIKAPNRRQRSAALERALRATAGTAQEGVLALLRKRQAQGLVTTADPLWIFNGISVTAAPSVIRELAARADVRRIDPDLTIQAPAMPGPTATTAPGPATPESNVTLVNAPALWNLGFRGQGVVVANMDTGVDGTHPDLAGRWRGGSNSWYDPYGQHPTVPTDVNGHGTATMGVMVGGDAGGTSIGIAPDARWIAVKVFNDRGSATSTAIHRGFQWLLDPDGNPDTADAADVVNDSWTLSAGGCNLDFQPDLAMLRAAGILPVFSAGNYGPATGTVFSPANNPDAFAVGATDNTDVIDPSSSRGPSACGQPTVPRAVAPGVNVRTTDLYGLYTTASGTSLAAPHVAGALALLLGAFPDLPADRQAAALEGGAVDLGPSGPDNAYGFGRLDALAAYRWLSTVPDFTMSASPSTATTTAGGTATYTVSVAGVNGFTGAVALSLAGLSAAQASWSFTPPVVYGGSGSSRLDVTTTAGLAPGSYLLTLTGTNGSTIRRVYATLVVPAPGFTVAATPASRSVPAGDTTTYTVAVGSLNGFTGNVALSLAGLPGAVGSSAFSPASIAGAGSSQLTITTLATAPPGTYSVAVTGTSGSVSHTATVTLTVTPRDFTLSASPSTVEVRRGQTATYTVSVESVGGFAGSVSLSATGLPTGASATFSPNPVGPPGSSTLQVRTTSSTPRATFTISVTGTAGALVHQVPVTLTVR
ncbi:S8 family serine peptidase [Dactylosporangium sp. NPDC049140]|uniref:S8 family serine peptidase n=1 Tax=Dactylosporangium sp. NPDC049140 TaxID=3155647 RepID=UPI0033CEE240